MTKARATTRTATTDLIQLTWYRDGVQRSREWLAVPESRDSIRAQRIGLMGSGARDVSDARISAGAEYVEYGEG